MMSSISSNQQRLGSLQRDLMNISTAPEFPKLRDSSREIQARISSLLTQTEQAKTTLEQACQVQKTRQQAVDAYKQLLEATETWLPNIASAIAKLHSIKDDEVCVTKIFQKCNVHLVTVVV